MRSAVEPGDRLCAAEMNERLYARAMSQIAEATLETRRQSTMAEAMCGSGAVVCSLFLLIRGAQRARCQAEIPLIVLCKFLRPALCIYASRLALPDLLNFNVQLPT